MSETTGMETNGNSAVVDATSDEEPPPGELDKPIIILYEKRAKKEVERFVPVKDKTEKAEPKELHVIVPRGKGAMLESMPEVIKNFATETDRDLKVIFTVLFGHKKVRVTDARKYLRKWNGWDVDVDSQEHHRFQEGIGNMTMENIKWAIDVLDIGRRGVTKKVDLVDRFCEWCLKPQKWTNLASDSSKQNKKGTQLKAPRPKELKDVKANKIPKKERKRKQERDPNKPKRPLTAFLLYMNKNRETIAEEVGSKNPCEVGKVASVKWKEMSGDDKHEFVEASQKLKQEYEKEMEKYNETTDKSSPKKAKIVTPNSKSKKSKLPSDPQSVPKPGIVQSVAAGDSGKFISKGTDVPSLKNDEGSKKTAKTNDKKASTNTIPTEKQIEKFLVKLIQKANLEKLTMKQVLNTVGERYPRLNVSSKKSFIKSKVKELIQ